MLPVRDRFAGEETRPMCCGARMTLRPSQALTCRTCGRSYPPGTEAIEETPRP